MLVSAISSVFNCENYINEMIDSVLAQTLQDWELILIDDASTDHTWELISKYTDPRIVKIRNEQNVGLTRNLNKALSLAKGKYIVRIDGDDIAYPPRFEKQVQYMEQNPSVVLAGCCMKVFGNIETVARIILGSDAAKVGLLFNAAIPHPTFISRKEVYEKYDIRYNEDLRYAQDYNLEYLLSKHGKIANSPDVLMKYREHDGQVSIKKREEQKRCANVTRKGILSDLGITLQEESFSSWENFCLLNYHQLRDDEIKELQELCKKIIEGNKLYKIFPEAKLEAILKKRIADYIEKCNSMLVMKKQQESSEDKYYSLFLLMCHWMQKKQLGKRISDYLTDRGMRKVAIYGIGYAGILLVEELLESSIEVLYVIDQNPDVYCIQGEVNVVSPNDELKAVDAIIVTPIYYFREIVSLISSKVECPIISLEDIIYN